MASDYGLNFGFRRSDESMATREGRHKTPKAGNQLRQGIAVELDPATPGYLKVCAADAPPVSGLRGVLVQEESHIGSVFDGSTYGHDSLDLGLCKRDQLSVMWAGVGTKFWFRNTDAYARGDRNRDAVEMVTEGGLVVGDQIGWDGAKWVEKAGAAAWLTVTAVSADYVEAVCTF